MVSGAAVKSSGVGAGRKIPVEGSSCRDFYGSDGTRTRDLRRDRPILVVPTWAGVGGDFRHQQGFPALALRGLPGASGSFRRPPAGSARDGLSPTKTTCVALRRTESHPRHRVLLARLPLRHEDTADAVLVTTNPNEVPPLRWTASNRPRADQSKQYERACPEAQVRPDR
jgi:hypothetical protein